GTPRRARAGGDERPRQPTGASAPAQRAEFTVIGLHVAVEFPRVVGDLDVGRWQAVVVPSRFAANVHAHLSGMSGHVHPQYGSVAAPASLARRTRRPHRGPNTLTITLSDP